MAEPSYGSVRRLMMFRNGCTVLRGEEEERTAGHRVRAWRRKRRKERMQRSRKLRETNSGRMEERERERESERGGGEGERNYRRSMTELPAVFSARPPAFTAQ